MIALLALATATPVAAFSYPGYEYSYYMNTINTTTLQSMGCSLGTARQGGSAPQDGLVILDYGQPSYDTTKGYGAWAFGGLNYVSHTQIENAVVAFAHGFWLCTGSNLTAHVRIGVGTTNYGNWTESAGFTDAMVVAHAKAWGSMVNSINTDISNAGYQNQTDAVAAADIEVSWGKPVTARSWVDAYDTVNNWSLYDYGDAAGCPQSGATKTAGTCNYYTPDGGAHKYYWHQNDLYYVSWQASPSWGVPEIYRTDGAQAKQWQQISKWATLNGLGLDQFAGSLTQHGACHSPGHSCDPTLDNTADIGWAQLRDKCAADSATALFSLRFAADITYH
jgi:hypothetical protein